jgi:hypothetical protein
MEAASKMIPLVFDILQKLNMIHLPFPKTLDSFFAGLFRKSETPSHLSSTQDDLTQAFEEYEANVRILLAVSGLREVLSFLSPALG